MDRQLVRNKNFMLYILGRLVSMIGSGVLTMALPLYVLDLTGKGSMMGVFGVLNLLPALVVLPFAGVLGDRLNRKHMMIVMDVANGLLLLFIFGLGMLGLTNLYVLMLFSVLASVFGAVFNAANGAMLPDLVTDKELGQATSSRAIVNSLAMVIGPLLGGMLYGFFGISIIFFIDGLSFLLSAISELFIDYQPDYLRKRQISQSLDDEKGNEDSRRFRFIGEIREGFGFAFAHSNLRRLFIFALGVNALISPLYAVIYPYIVRKELGYSAQAMGVIETGFVVGLLVGNLIFMGFLVNKDFKVVMKTGFILSQLVLVAVGVFFLPPIIEGVGKRQFVFLAVLVGLIFLQGVVNATINVPIEINLQKMIPTEFRSRIFSALGVLGQIGVPIGIFLFGLLLDFFQGYQISLLAVGLSLILTIWFLLKAPDSLYHGQLSDESITACINESEKV